MTTTTQLRGALDALTRAVLAALADHEPEPVFITAPDQAVWKRHGQETLLLQHREIWQHPLFLASSHWWARQPEMGQFHDALTAAGLDGRVDTLVGALVGASGRPLIPLLITEILTPLIAGTRTYRFDEAVFADVYQAWETGLRQDTARFVDVLPLLGFEAAQSVDLSLPGGLEIRMMTERELSYAVQALGVPIDSMFGTNTLQVSRANQFALVITHSFPLHFGPITGNPTGFPLPTFDATHLVTALRLVCGGSVCLGRPLRMRHPDDFDAPGGHSAARTPVTPPDPARTTVIIEPAQMELVRTFTALLAAPHLDADRAVRLALRRIVAAGALGDPEDRLIDLLIAAEALLIQRPGLPRSLGKRDRLAAAAVATLAQDPSYAGRDAELRQLIVSAYERRNHAMHADASPAPLFRLDGTATEDLAAVVGDLEQVMRRIALYAVADAARAAAATTPSA